MLGPLYGITCFVKNLDKLYELFECTIINTWCITCCLVFSNRTCFNKLPDKSQDNRHKTSPSCSDSDSNGQSEYLIRGGHKPLPEGGWQNERELVEEWLEGGLSLQQINTNYGQFRFQWNKLRKLSVFFINFRNFHLHSARRSWNKSAFRLQQYENVEYIFLTLTEKKIWNKYMQTTLLGK